MFLNPKEKEHIDLDNEIKALKGNLSLFINENLKPDIQVSSENYLKLREKIEGNIVKITTLSQDIFKKEWERIKKGS